LPSPEELCQRGRSQSVGRDRGEQDEYRLALSDVHVLRLVDTRPETVPRTYAHLLPQSDELAAEQVAALLV
jgi:hypothetical protein